MAKPKRSRSAMKALRQSRKRQVRNQSAKSKAKTLTKGARAAGQAERPVAVKVAVRALDKAASKGIIHPRTAARRKSRLMKARPAKA